MTMRRRFIASMVALTLAVSSTAYADDRAVDEAWMATASQPSGDFKHTPASVQSPDSALSLSFEYTGSLKLKSVVVRYKSSGMPEYKRITLKKSGKSGWTGTIPAGDVTRGVVRYYVLGVAADGSPLAGSGSAREPYFVPVRANGDATPTPATPTTQQTPETPETPESAPTPDDAPKDSERGGYARVWIGVSGSIDFVSLPAASDACKLSSSALPISGYYCTNPDGSDFPNRGGPTENATLAKGHAGNAGGGFTGRDVRVMVSFDYAFTTSFLLGARVGYVAGTYPGSAASKDGHAFSMPLHLELRGTYLFGDDPLVHNGAAPYVSAGAGATELDAPTTVQVTQTGIAGSTPKVAWITAGPLFFSLGAGVRYAFSPRAAFSAGARFIGGLGGSAGFLPAYAPEIGFAYGF